MPIWDSQARCPDRVQALIACACMETALKSMDDAMHCIHRMHGCQVLHVAWAVDRRGPRCCVAPTV